MEHIIRLLKEHGFDDLIVTVAFIANNVRTYFGNSRVPQSGCAARGGSACSYSGRPSNSASAQSSRGKCAGTQSIRTPMPARCSASTRIPEVVRGAQPGGGRVEAGDLIAPGAAEGVLGDRHQLDVGEAQVLDVGGELLGQLTVRQARPPGRQMHLVDGERRLVHGHVRRAAPSTPSSVHSWCEAVHDRGGGGRAPRSAGPSGRRAACASRPGG